MRSVATTSRSCPAYLRRLALGAALILAGPGSTGCAHPFLKASGTLASGLQQGDEALAALAGAEAATQRVYRYARLLPASFPADAAHLEDEFLDEACRPHAAVLLHERIALDDLGAFQQFLAAAAAGPKDPDLLRLLGAFLGKAPAFEPKDPDKAVEEYRQQRLRELAGCKAAVRETFTRGAQQELAFAPGLAAVAAAWPKIKELLTAVLAAEEEAKREQAILDAFRGPAQKDLDAALSVLEASTASDGALGRILSSQRQLALWTAYAEYRAIALGLELSLERQAEWTRNPAADRKAKRDREAEALARDREVVAGANRMAAALKVYDDLSGVDPAAVVKKMGDSLHQLRAAAERRVAPEGSFFTDLVAAVQFFSDAAKKLEASASALAAVGASRF